MGGEISEMTTFTTEDREAAAMPMSALELADAVKSIYIDNPLAPTEFLMAVEATLRGQQSQIEILKIQISNLDLENIALNEQLESYLFK